MIVVFCSCALVLSDTKPFIKTCTKITHLTALFSGWSLVQDLEKGMGHFFFLHNSTLSKSSFLFQIYKERQREKCHHTTVCPSVKLPLVPRWC